MSFPWLGTKKKNNKPPPWLIYMVMKHSRFAYRETLGNREAKIKACHLSSVCMSGHSTWAQRLSARSAPQQKLQHVHSCGQWLFGLLKSSPCRRGRTRGTAERPQSQDILRQSDHRDRASWWERLQCVGIFMHVAPHCLDTGDWGHSGAVQGDPDVCMRLVSWHLTSSWSTFFLGSSWRVSTISSEHPQKHWTLYYIYTHIFRYPNPACLGFCRTGGLLGDLREQNARKTF